MITMTVEKEMVLLRKQYELGNSFNVSLRIKKLSRYIID